MSDAGPPPDGPPIVEAPPPRTLPLPLHRSVFTRALLIFNVLVYIVVTLAADNGLFSAAIGGADIRTLIDFGAKFNPAILDGEYWRFLTPVFLHIGLIHLLFNQYALSIIGRQVERLFGPGRFLTIYLLSGIGGSIASFATSPAVAAGASGAIFGIIGTLAAFFVRNREILGDMGRQQLRSLLGLIAINLFLGASIPGIDNAGHMGGLVIGTLLGLLFAPTYTLETIPVPPYRTVHESRSAFPGWLLPVGGALLLAVAAMLAVQIAPVAPVR